VKATYFVATTRVFPSNEPTRTLLSGHLLCDNTPGSLTEPEIFNRFESTPQSPDLMRLVDTDDAGRRLVGSRLPCPLLEVRFLVEPGSSSPSLARYLTDQRSNLLVDLRTSNRHLRLPTPIKTEPLSVPFDDRIGFDDDQDFPPIFPESRQHHPEEPISPMKLRPLHRTVEDGKLLAKSKNLHRETDSGFDQRTEK